MGAIFATKQKEAEENNRTNLFVCKQARVSMWVACAVHT